MQSSRCMVRESMASIRSEVVAGEVEPLPDVPDVLGADAVEGGVAALDDDLPDVLLVHLGLQAHRKELCRGGPEKARTRAGNHPGHRPDNHSDDQGERPAEGHHPDEPPPDAEDGRAAV